MGTIPLLTDAARSAIMCLLVGSALNNAPNRKVDCALVAQLEEHILGRNGVPSSILGEGSRSRNGEPGKPNLVPLSVIVVAGSHAGCEEVDSVRKEARIIITMACNECKSRNYATSKNKQNDTQRLELKKFCSRCRTHTTHREAK